MPTDALPLQLPYINWRSIPAVMPGVKPRKVPWCAVSGRPIDHLDPANWLDHDAAAGRVSGDIHLGQVLPREPSGRFLIDLDNCRDPATGVVQPWAQTILTTMSGACVEVSHSETGLHVTGRCDPARVGDLRHKWTPDGAPPNAVEFYHAARFIACGRPVPGVHGDPDKDMTDALLQVVPARAPFVPVVVVSGDGPAPDYSGPEDDDELLAAMRHARVRAGGDLAPGIFPGDFFRPIEEFGPLWVAARGADPAKPPPWNFDGSSADYSLMNFLAFWTGGDIPRMVRLHARSVMGQRDKAQQRPDYVLHAAQRPAAEARASGSYLNRPNVDSIIRQIQADPTTAAHRLAEPAAALSSADRDRVLAECRVHGVLTAMKDAIKRQRAVRAVTESEARRVETALGPLAHYYIVRNEGGQAMAIDDRGGAQPQSRAALRDAHDNLPPVAYVDGGGVLRSRHAVDDWWGAEDTPRYDMTGYDPLQGVEYQDDAGRVLRNTYRPAHDRAPEWAGSDAADPWLHIIRANFPDPGDQTTLLQCLAAMVQYPGRLLRWAPVLQGTPGCGKGAIAEAVTYAHGRHNTAHPSPDVIATDFNGYMHRKTLVVVNEIGDHTKRELSSLAEKLKPWITDSPISIHAKGRDAVDQPNHACWIFTTNHMHCMLATPGERRYAHFISALQSDEAARAVLSDAWWQDYYDWWNAGGAESVRSFLWHMPISVPVTAPATSTTARAMQAGESAPMTLIREALADALPGFRGGWISGNAVRELLAGDGVKMPSNQFLPRVLDRLGYTECHRVRTSPAEAMRFPSAPSRTRLYATAGTDAGGAAMAAYDAAQGDR